ncbi:MAG: sulfatase-like hydrolase/transferase [Fulvivirga sp.]|nr:sulfatase-like hydrolase/transferase [Fulvivirga sp.]
MKNRVRLFLSYGLFWLIIFVIARLIFISYHFKQSTDNTIGDMLLSMLHGLRLDLSAVGYFLIIPGLLLVASAFIKKQLTAGILHTYTGLLVFVSLFVIILDLEMYTHWGFRLDATPLLYIGDDTTIAIDTFSIIKLIIFWIICFIAAFFLYKAIVLPRIKALEPATWPTAVVMLLLTGCLIAPIRGTTGVAPINTGTVYFHNSNMFANHAAINAVWNTGYALKKINRLKYPSNFLDRDRTAKYFDELYDASGKTTSLINENMPNVILIVLESYTYKLIEPLGGVKDVTPNFNRLVNEGILFDNFYSSGDRTDKGIVSILSGYPAQPLGSIIKYPRKTQRLPFINKTFQALGYETGFTYGGNIDFANFRSYLSNAQFNTITHSQHFPDSLNQSKWGVHDGYVFKKFLKECNRSDQPFFKVLLTLSSHEPFEVPMKPVFEGDTEISKFLNSAYYTDSVFGDFIAAAKEQEWWDNTLVVVTADHGHRLPENDGVGNPKRFKIPMLWLGGALQVRDTVMHTYGSQTDIPNTLLGQVAKPNPEFLFSKNMMDQAHHDFAVFVYNNGYGYLDEDKTIIYDNVGRRYIQKQGIKGDEDLLPGMSYIQQLYNDYNSR